MFPFLYVDVCAYVCASVYECVCARVCACVCVLLRLMFVLESGWIRVNRIKMGGKR